MGSRRVSTPSGHSGEIAFSCAPAADSALASGGQPEVQAVIQQFPYNLKPSYKGCTKLKKEEDNMHTHAVVRVLSHTCFRKLYLE